MPDSSRIEELKRRVQMDPASIAFAALAEEFRRAGRYEEAIDVCRTGLQRHPSYISAHVTLGRALLEVGQYDDARQELEYVLSVAPENLAAIRGLAEIHHRQGQSSEGTDLTVSQMADMVSRPSPIPMSAQPWEAPPPEAVETAPRQAAAVETPELQPPAGGLAEPEPQVNELPQVEQPGFGASEPEPVIEIIEPDAVMDMFEAATPVYEIAHPEPPVAAAPPPRAPVAPVVITRPEPLKDDPALQGLEAFLQAILRARESAGGIHTS